MKRAQKRTHLLIWLILGPAIIAVLILAIQHRPDTPINDTLPEVLLDEAHIKTLSSWNLRQQISGTQSLGGETAIRGPGSALRLAGMTIRGFS